MSSIDTLTVSRGLRSRAIIKASLSERLTACRQHTLRLVRPLSAEDMVVQPMDDASPTKWHLAHTTWFFETFVLRGFDRSYAVFDESFAYCFNSYYESLGARQPRGSRGLLTRPSLKEVLDYRGHVDDALDSLLARRDLPAEVLSLVELGINHEQQHQELILSDILALFAAGPLRPAYDVAMAPAARVDGPLAWIDVAGGIEQIGNDGSVFGWDNEFPRHTALIHPFRIADRLVTSGEWLAFIQDGGYRTPSLWLADGWAAVQREGWRAPLYWFEQDGAWQSFSLRGVHAVDHDVPVTHVSYFEADAFARWAGHRLPTEFEWEVASRRAPLLRQMFGVAWQWTQSAYAPYPGYRPAAGVAPQLVV